MAATTTPAVTKGTVTLNCCIAKASDLVIRDDCNDPMVVFRVDTEDEQRTPVVHNTSDPVWNLAFSKQCKTSSVICFSVWDFNVSASNNFLGSCSIPLSEVTNTPTEHVLVLEGVEKGTLTVTVSFSGWVAAITKPRTGPRLMAMTPTHTAAIAPPVVATPPQVVATAVSPYPMKFDHVAVVSPLAEPLRLFFSAGVTQIKFLAEDKKSKIYLVKTRGNLHNVVVDLIDAKTKTALISTESEEGGGATSVSMTIVRNGKELGRAHFGKGQGGKGKITLNNGDKVRMQGQFFDSEFKFVTKPAGALIATFSRPKQFSLDTNIVIPANVDAALIMVCYVGLVLLDKRRHHIAHQKNFHGH
ncbi:hypothetical protein Pelo_4949 [Pelomyxa schiedti]|nr:hypothetical protein Pelo_4949 [Pelomyxa schiedti]